MGGLRWYFEKNKKKSSGPRSGRLFPAKTNGFSIVFVMMRKQNINSLLMFCYKNQWFVNLLDNHTQANKNKMQLLEQWNRYVRKCSEPKLRKWCNTKCWTWFPEAPKIWPTPHPENFADTARANDSPPTKFSGVWGSWIHWKNFDVKILILLLLLPLCL